MFSQISLKNNLYAQVRPASVESVLHLIKTGSEDITELLRVIRDPGISEEERKENKSLLPTAFFCGTLIGSHRTDCFFGEHTGLLVLDYDHLNEGVTTQQVKDVAIKHPSVVAVFVSPSGNGIKVVYYSTPPPSGTPEEMNKYAPLYKLYAQAAYRAASDDVFGDMVISDVSAQKYVQACYIPYDPDIYINMDATPTNLNVDYMTIYKDYVAAQERRNQSNAVYNKLVSTDQAAEALNSIPAEEYGSGNDKYMDMVKIIAGARAAGIDVDSIYRWAEGTGRPSNHIDTVITGSFGSIGPGTLFYYARQHGYELNIDRRQMRRYKTQPIF